MLMHKCTQGYLPSFIVCKGCKIASDNWEHRVMLYNIAHEMKQKPEAGLAIINGIKSFQCAHDAGDNRIIKRER